VSDLRAIVVIPARDEVSRIARCLAAFGEQRGLAADAFGVVVVLDGCRDATETVARAAAARAGLGLEIVSLPIPRGVGVARWIGMERACARLEAAGQPDGLIACTDADTEPGPDWLAAQLALIEAGAAAIGGRIDLDPVEAASLPPDALTRRSTQARIRLAAVLAEDAGADHHFFSGASMGVSARAYRAVGGLEPATALEDEGFARRLAAGGLRIVRSDRVRVRTSARTDGRAPRGLSRDLELGRWLATRRYDGDAYDLERLRAAKGNTTVSVVIPARDCADTVGGVLRGTVRAALDAGLVDEVLVVDGQSADATRSVAQRAGATVVAQDELLPEYGPALGKGDAMWRAVSATRGDVVAFLDADTADPDPRHLLGVLGPLLEDEDIALVKASFGRPFLDGAGLALPDEGGRVTELMARPLLNLYVPQLAGFVQPLAGETAARRGLLRRLAFPVGYGVEVAILIDALRLAGLDALAEVAVGTRQNHHQPLRDLGAMAFAVLCAVQRRVDPASAVPAGLVQPWSEGAVRDVPVLERPPLAEIAKSGGRLTAV
jgi:glucosyl-3-phosphoglycerate synthase